MGVVTGLRQAQAERVLVPLVFEEFEIAPTSAQPELVEGHAQRATSTSTKEAAANSCPRPNGQNRSVQRISAHRDPGDESYLSAYDPLADIGISVGA